MTYHFIALSGIGEPGALFPKAIGLTENEARVKILARLGKRYPDVEWWYLIPVVPRRSCNWKKNA